MPACVFNIIRRPNEGQSVNVFNAVIAAMEAHGRPGNVTTALTSPQPLGSGVNVLRPSGSIPSMHLRNSTMVSLLTKLRQQDGMKQRRNASLLIPTSWR